MRTRLSVALVAAALICPLFAVPAHAQRARVFVASYGNDANPCTFLSPCKTFQQAVNVVAAGGEVTAIDSAGFGPIDISKSVTITSPPGVEAGVTAVTNNQSAIVIHPASHFVVTLRGLTVEGGGTGLNGIILGSTGGERSTSSTAWSKTLPTLASRSHHSPTLRPPC
jgi:hypothetical protein